MTRYDPTDPINRADPYPMYARLRGTEPVHHSTGSDAWVITRHADAVAVLRGPVWSNDHRHSTTESSRRRRAAIAAGEAPDLMGIVLLFMDPPDHTRVRSLVASAFTPRMVERLRPRVEALVTEALDAAEREGTVDLLSAVAYPVPVAVIAELLGVPLEDRDWFREVSAKVTPLLDDEPAPAVLAEAGEAVGAFAEYFSGLVERRREHPTDDLVSGLVAAHVEGERLTHEELITMCILLLVAGHETTMNLICNGTLALLRQRDQLEALARDPGLGRPGVDELLRYDSPVQLTARTALEDVELDGQRIRAGEQALVLLGAANRDPAVFADPDRVDLARSDNHHLAFSHGRHFCLGAALARLEGEVVFGQVAARFPDLELATDEVEWRETVTLRGVTGLPVRLR